MNYFTANTTFKRQHTALSSVCVAKRGVACVKGWEGLSEHLILLMEHCIKRLYDGWKIQFLTRRWTIKITCLHKTQEILLSQLNHTLNIKWNIFPHVRIMIRKTCYWGEQKERIKIQESVCYVKGSWLDWMWHLWSSTVHLFTSSSWQKGGLKNRTNHSFSIWRKGAMFVVINPGQGMM